MSAADETRPRARLDRRRFLHLSSAGVLSLAGSRRERSTIKYRVGVGRDAHPYAATERALRASLGWPPKSLAGRKVIIKPNLVAGAPAATGITTDPEVVRAVVDMALAARAAEVMVVEGAPGDANFSVCGYGFFEGYAPGVALVGLHDQPVRLVDVPGGLAYRQIYLPDLLLADDVVFASVGKMKCHVESLVTLSAKNLFGLPPVDHYTVPDALGRFAMHDRGVHQAIVDLMLVRPVDLAVVDGIWAMEGNGPWGGTPVRMNLVVAGDNAVAVDRVCLAAMGILQSWVQHLAYAAIQGQGPADLGNVEIHGDPLVPRAFLLPDIPPSVDMPRAEPSAYRLGSRQPMVITYWVNRSCWTQVEIIRASESSPQVARVRLLRDWTGRPAGPDAVAWDGRDDQGQLVSPGFYLIRVQATHGQLARNAFATSWVTVVGDEPVFRQYLPLVSHQPGRAGQSPTTARRG